MSVAIMLSCPIQIVLLSVAFVDISCGRAECLDREPSSQAHSLPKFWRLKEAETEEEHETAWRKLHRALQSAARAQDGEGLVVKMDPGKLVQIQPPDSV
ncbi:hypothetical protein T265_11764 [Opisthorchis viverrini]|uniref:Uncharacterized protein n=1 Tax=Opisthorchis viverrini TaxID=6198 RepID=A0A074YXT0_OPIVI|nr:hypothetical protein T265_11764 [Opisthorchis viverrini]KER19478.1 hypothetical protein T265_11764 [Opisthorchis viverrini]